MFLGSFILNLEFSLSTPFVAPRVTVASLFNVLCSDSLIAFISQLSFSLLFSKNELSLTFGASPFVWTFDKFNENGFGLTSWLGSRIISLLELIFIFSVEAGFVSLDFRF